MLIKVMKHEAKAVGRLLLPLFLVALGLGALSRLLGFLAELVWQPAGFFFNTFGNVLGVLLCVGVLAVVFIYVLVRFWHSMMGTESLLSFSLPVKAGTHIWGRFGVHTLYILLGVCVAIACLFIAIPGFAGTFSEMPYHVNIFGESATIAPTELPLGSVLAAAFAFVLLAIVINLSKFYAAFAIGTQLRERLVGSVVGFIALSVIEGLLILPALLVPLLGIGRNMDEFIRYFQNNTGAGILNFTWLMLGCVAVYGLVCTVAHFIIAHVCFGKRLNVE